MQNYSMHAAANVRRMTRSQSPGGPGEVTFPSSLTPFQEPRRLCIRAGAQPYKSPNRPVPNQKGQLPPANYRANTYEHIANYCDGVLAHLLLRLLAKESL